MRKGRFTQAWCKPNTGRRGGRYGAIGCGSLLFVDVKPFAQEAVLVDRGLKYTGIY